VTVTQPCVSPDTGTLSPDLRVFYQYGMVLGLDDFVQEQTHNLGLDYHHERALHGYGTVYGLHVTTSTPPDAPDDVTLTVEHGMAVDQRGRELTVPSAQCARLGAWLAAQEVASPGTIDANLGISGELVVYVTAAYAECSDDLIPLPGQPCSTSSQVQKPSRLRDAWDIQLRWTPPAMPAWDAVRQLAQLLNSIQLVSGPDLSLASDEQAIIDAVLALPSPAIPSGSRPAPVSYQLPADAADAVFDRIFTAWVTEVRPQLAPDLTAPDPNWDSAILLATVTFTPQTPFSASSPVITSYADPDDSGRPYLLHTGLIQELRLGGQAGAALAASPSPPPLVQQAVTLSSTVNSDGVPTLTAWFHLPDPVSLPATIQVADENGQTAAFTTEVASGAGPFSPLWTLSPPSSGFAVTEGDQLAATFPGAAVLVGNSATTLAATVTAGGLLDADGSGDVTAYATVRGTFPAGASFVTVSFVPSNGSSHIELWFHPQSQGVRENVFVSLTSPSVQVINDLTGAVLFPQAGESPAATANQNIWTIPMTATMQKALPTLPAYLRLVFSTEQTSVDFSLLPPIGPPGGGHGIVTGLPILRRSVPLADWINSTGIRYVGWEGSTIVAFARIAAAESEGAVGD
jgi:hypothetical protein